MTWAISYPGILWVDSTLSSFSFCCFGFGRRRDYVRNLWDIVSKHDPPLLGSEKVVDSQFWERRGKAKQNRTNQSKWSRKGASEWNNRGNLTGGQAMGQSKVPVWWLLFSPLCDSVVLTTQTGKKSLGARLPDRVMGKVVSEEALSLSPSPWSNRWAQHMPKQPVSASCCRTDLWSWTNREKSLRAPASGHEEIWASHRVKFWKKAVKLQPLLPSLWLHSLWQLHYLWKMTELCSHYWRNLRQEVSDVLKWKWCMSVLMYLSGRGPLYGGVAEIEQAEMVTFSKHTQTATKTVTSECFFNQILAR